MNPFALGLLKDVINRWPNLETRAGLTLDVRIPLAFENESLRAILEIALRPARLEYRVEASVIKIVPAKGYSAEDK